MAMMNAFRLLDWQHADMVQVPVPEPGPGEVLIRVAGVGLCHSDITFMDVHAGVLNYQVPFTLGHETTGWVAAVGAGVDDLPLETPVIACAHYWCGSCEYCLRGQDNYCTQYTTGGPGYGADGGLAEFAVFPRKLLLGLGDIDPRTAGPLSDAAVTAYHALRSVLHLLHPGTDVVVIGAGGLGGYGIQLLRRLTGARIIATDTDERRLEAARALGAHVTVAPGGPIDERLRAATDGRGADVVLDFVGTDATIATSFALARRAGTVIIIGAGGGSGAVGWGRIAPECHVYITLASTMADLHDVVALAAGGGLVVPHETFPFAQVTEAYDRLRQGTLLGRAIVVMD